VSRESPLSPRDFFSGVWQATGELVPRGPARLVLRREALTMHGTGEWLGERVVLVRERFELASGWRFERRMFLEQVAPDRLRVTADDMPLGATVRLEPDGFVFERFRTWLPFRGVRFRMRCASDARVQPDGSIAGALALSWLGIPVARMTLRIERRAGS
jgi:hypothetical protein